MNLLYTFLRAYSIHSNISPSICLMKLMLNHTNNTNNRVNHKDQFDRYNDPRLYKDLMVNKQIDNTPKDDIEKYSKEMDNRF